MHNQNILKLPGGVRTKISREQSQRHPPTFIKSFPQPTEVISSPHFSFAAPLHRLFRMKMQRFRCPWRLPPAGKHICLPCAFHSADHTTDSTILAESTVSWLFAQVVNCLHVSPLWWVLRWDLWIWSPPTGHDLSILFTPLAQTQMLPRPGGWAVLGPCGWPPGLMLSPNPLLLNLNPLWAFIITTITGSTPRLG